MKKNIFITIILSFFPGLSHFYIGAVKRGFVFITGTIITSIGGLGLYILSYSDEIFLAATAAVLAVIWLIAFIDAVSLREKIDSNVIYSNNEKVIEEKSFLNEKVITMFLSVIPGAGHMYNRYQKKGLTFMTVFFFTVFFMGWLNISLFMFVLPIIWFYSFFDALYLVSEEKPKEKEEDDFELTAIINHKWIGWGLIAVGAIIVIERIVFPLIPWEIQRQIQTLIVAAVFIAGGVKILSGGININLNKGEKEKWEEEDQ